MKQPLLKVLSLGAVAGPIAFTHGCSVDNSCLSERTCPVDAADTPLDGRGASDSQSVPDGAVFETSVDAPLDTTVGGGTDAQSETSVDVSLSDALFDASVDGGATMDGRIASDGGGPDPDATTREASVDAGVCGNGRLDPGEQCDQGSANVASGYGKGLCTTQCRIAPFCGDNVVSAPELCDSGGVIAPGSCNPECNGYYQTRLISETVGVYSTNLGGIGGADLICQTELGVNWKALLVGGSRRATVTPFVGDNQQDWVIHKYTYYINSQNQVIWRTDNVPLLGVIGGVRQDLNAPAFDAGGGVYPWSGWATDWTTIADVAGTGTCLGWTSASQSYWGNFANTQLTGSASELCGTSSTILCVQQ